MDDGFEEIVGIDDGVLVGVTDGFDEIVGEDDGV